MPLKYLIRALPILVLLQCVQKKEVVINYLNQEPAGREAVLFSPGLISTDAYEHSAPAFSPDGTVVLWTVIRSNGPAAMLEMVHENGSWSVPQRPSFADTTADDFYPSFSPDGQVLYFGSRRKSPQGYPQGPDMRIWQVARKAGKWGTPVPFDTTVSVGREFAHSITADGNIFFSSSASSSSGFNIRMAEKSEQGYTTPVWLPFNINGIGYEDGPFVAPDGSFVIFESDRPGTIDGSLDLYITFRKEQQQWTLPVNMGPAVNSGFAERFARLSPDGKYLFFGSTRRGNFDIYWIDASVIDSLKRNVPEEHVIERAAGDSVFAAINESDLNGAIEELNTWTAVHPPSLDAAVLRASLLRRQKRYEEAVELLESAAVGEWQNDASVRMELAVCKFGLSKNEQAEEILGPLLVEGSQQWSRLMHLGRVLLEMGEFEEGDSYFEQAMAISSHYYHYYRRGRAYVEAGDHNRAFVYLEKAVGLGYGSRQDLEADQLLAVLHSDRRWKQLMQKLE